MSTDLHVSDNTASLIRKVTVRKIGLAACHLYDIEPEQLFSPARSHSVARIRQLVCYVAHRKFGHPYSHIGRVLGRDHTTILHAVRSIESDLSDPLVAQKVQELTAAAEVALPARAAPTDTPVDVAPTVVARSTIDDVMRLKSRGFPVKAIARYLDLEEHYVALVCGHESWKGRELVMSKAAS